MITRRSTTRAGLVLATTALLAAAPASSLAQPVDLRSPDAVPASRSAPQTDLRSPDAASPVRGIAVARDQLAADKRSPDAIDAATRADGARWEAQERYYGSYGHPAPEPRVVQLASDGFDGGDAAIGAGGALALVLIAGSGGMALTRRRRHAPAIS